MNDEPEMEKFFEEAVKSFADHRFDDAIRQNIDTILTRTPRCGRCRLSDIADHHHRP